MSQKKKILVLIDWFLPGIKAGGPVRSVASLVNKLNEQFEFYILTSDTDLGENQSYAGIISNTWIDHKKNVKVFYKSTNTGITEAFINAIEEIKPDCIYINSFFSKDFSIVPLRLIKSHKINSKVILAPRGMLSEGALKIKPFKKKIFITLSKILGLHKQVLWHSTKRDESIAIKKIFGENIKLFEVNNITDIEIRTPEPKKQKVNGELNLIYLGRVARNKNLSLVLKALKKINTGSITLDIFGNIEDDGYWKECGEIINQLPENVQVRFMGSIQPTDIGNIVTKYHFLTLLSYSENFGHAIVEALASSLPVIISNTTPWQNLETNNAGWDVNITNELEASRAYKIALQMENEEYYKFSCGANIFARTNCLNPLVIENTIKMLS